MSDNETIFETSKKQQIEEPNNNSTNKESTEGVEKGVKEEEIQKPKRRRGRPKGKPITDPEQIEKLKKNLVKGRMASMEARKRKALLKKIDEEEISNAKRELENKKIEKYMNSKKLTPILEEKVEKVSDIIKPEIKPIIKIIPKPIIRVNNMFRTLF